MNDGNCPHCGSTNVQFSSYGCLHHINDEKEMQVLRDHYECLDCHKTFGIPHEERVQTVTEKLEKGIDNFVTKIHQMPAEILMNRGALQSLKIFNPLPSMSPDNGFYMPELPVSPTFNSIPIRISAELPLNEFKLI